MEDLTRRSLFFVAPYHVSVRKERIGLPGPNEILVQTVVSSISAGTELLVYRNRFPKELLVDESIPGLKQKFGYPMKYGYSAVGRVIACGANLEKGWERKSVFSFHPHESHFLALPTEVCALPPTLSLDQAALLPALETSIHLVSEGLPMIGEKVVVFGQGVIGLMTTALLARMDLGNLITVDYHGKRREASVALGAFESLDPKTKVTQKIRSFLKDGDGYEGADLVFELSGDPNALNQAIEVAGYRGRVVIGSFYGNKRSSLDLGGRFHRSGIRLISSQVSRIQPEFSGSWNKSRRLGLALRLLEKLNLSHLLTHQIPIEKAQEGYSLLDRKPEDVIQILLTY